MEYRMYLINDMEIKKDRCFFFASHEEKNCMYIQKLYTYTEKIHKHFFKVFK
jgi:hypothetical protein